MHDVNDADFEIVLPDTEPPTTTITDGPADGAYLVDREVTFSYSSSEPGRFTCMLDDEPVGCTGSSVTLTGLAGGTHVFSVAAVDVTGNTDPTPEVRTFTVPFDDTELARSSGWSSVTDAAAFGGSYSVAVQKDATLRTRIEGATGVALVVTTASGDGKVDVLLDGARVGSVSLDSRTGGTRVLVPVADWTARSGELTLVTSNKKPVRIDGLAVRTD